MIPVSWGESRKEKDQIENLCMYVFISHFGDWDKSQWPIRTSIRTSNYKLQYGNTSHY